MAFNLSIDTNRLNELGPGVIARLMGREMTPPETGAKQPVVNESEVLDGVRLADRKRQRASGGVLPPTLPIVSRANNNGVASQARPNTQDTQIDLFI